MIIKLILCTFNNKIPVFQLNILKFEDNDLPRVFGDSQITHTVSKYLGFIRNIMYCKKSGYLPTIINVEFSHFILKFFPSFDQKGFIQLNWARILPQIFIES